MATTEKAFTYWMEFLDMSNSYSRRMFLKVSGVAIASTAGCIGSPDPISLTIWNHIDEEINASITVTQTSDNEEVLSDTATIPANDTTDYQDLLQIGTGYDFDVSVENGPEKSVQRGIDDSAISFMIDILEDSIYAGQVVR